MQGAHGFSSRGSGVLFAVRDIDVEDGFEHVTDRVHGDGEVDSNGMFSSFNAEEDVVNIHLNKDMITIENILKALPHSKHDDCAKYVCGECASSHSGANGAANSFGESISDLDVTWGTIKRNAHT